MDFNKQRLKNRLNVKFEPLRLQPPSLKKLGVISRAEKEVTREEKPQREGSALESTRNRSISQLRLPSLDHKPPSKRGEDRAEEIINMREVRQRIKSIKVLPTIKVESREPINDTITYLLKREILTIPKIVAMLQKSHSEEFLYMRVTGIYEFQACGQEEKGSSYITVSRNGMVREGELTPLDELVREYDLFTKLKKNHFFRYYLGIKFLTRWRRGSRIIKFVENRFKVQKALGLDNERVPAWRVQLKELLLVEDSGGHIGSGWVGRVAREIESNKAAAEAKLLEISVKLLQKFQLPISDSFQLMNKVLGNLLSLNINFQKKIRIEKELELVYKLGLMLEFHQLQSIAFFLLEHLDRLTSKFQDKNAQYLDSILVPMEALDFNSPNYSQQKESLLHGTTFKEDISFKMSLDSDGEVIIQPPIRSVVAKIKSDIKDFVSRVEGFDYHIIRTSKFDYVVKNVVKPHEADHSSLNSKEVNLKQYIYSINAYYQRMQDLQASAALIEATMARRIRLTAPFQQLHQKYRQRLSEKAYSGYNYEQISQEVEEVETAMATCQAKLHDGEYFVLGYLSQLELKEQVISALRQYKDSVLSVIPAKIRENREALMRSLETHLTVLRTVVKSPDDFIRVQAECEDIEEKIAGYAGELMEVERLQELYLRVRKIESPSLVEEKGMLNELRMKAKNFRDTRENSFLLYKRELETIRKDLQGKVDAIAPTEADYEPSPRPSEVYYRCHDTLLRLQGLADELKHLNHLQAFFDLRTTLIPRLETLLMKFQSLQDIWLMAKELEGEREIRFGEPIMQLEAQPLIKKYEQYLRKAERYNKDPDYYRLAQHLLQQLPLLLNSLYFTQDLRNPILRAVDYQQITQLLQREYKQEGKSAKELSLGQVYSLQLWGAREQVMQVSFKSHKEQEIRRLLREYEQWWKGIKLEGEWLEEYPLIIIFAENDQLRREIEEYTTVLLGIINHKYGGFARKECNNHLRNINNLASLLELAIAHQQKFLSLFPVLTSRYAEKQLPSEAKKFMAILQKSMKNVKWLVRPTENLNENTRSMLEGHIKQFDALAKTLSSFLEKKRVKFQRFYFLQDDELLEVLVGIGAENTIFRMFEGIRGWLADKEGVKNGVEGVGGERLILRGWSYKQQEPEVVFKSLQDAIRSNLNSLVRNTLHAYQNQLKELRVLYPGVPWMCVYAVELILFTKQVEINCFQNGVDLRLQASLMQENIAAAVAAPLENSNYITLQLFLLHFTEELRREEVRNVFDFRWHSFLRFYYEKEGVVMRVMGAEHSWGGEYQGLWNLMISTSDIRRAHTSILSNLRHGNGVLLQGPSGTGKTESLKELGRCMAKYCVIFNCSSEVNIRTLQKLLSGLCYTGSWLCLDEINRLTAEIMSVVATQINSVRGAVIQSKQVFSFMGKEMRLRKGVGIFSTMNPIYLKRAKLTESLKSYFRVISVNVPDYEKILEVMLYGLGIASSSAYSHRISSLFKNLSIQLAQRPQYDFGLRAMKFFIFNLSIVRRSVRSEEESVIEALCKTFYSRLEAEDRETFLRVVQDMFGRKLEQKAAAYKVTMMREAPQTGIIVLGPTSCKSTLISEYVSLFPSTRRVQVFNPNSLQMKYFLGEAVMGRWEQGVVERMARGSFQNPSIDYILVLDCKLRSQTIQNFNTLLDDSKLLSLSNGTRLKIHNNFKVILQTPDLEMTSPATITRCNVIFVSQQDVPKEDLIRRLLPALSSSQAEEKMMEALKLFSQEELQRIVKVARLLFLRRVAEGERLTESESIGFEKALFFSMQLMGGAERVKHFLHKDNSVAGKKSPFWYCLSFSRYKEGEFLELEAGSPFRTLGETYIPTLRGSFYAYVNRRAYENCENVIWKGERMSGKTTALEFSLQEVFKGRAEQKNLLRVPISPESAARGVGAAMDERMGSAEERAEDSKPLLIFVDDIHLGCEEISQFFRFSSEYHKFFSYKSKEVVPLSRHALIADANNSYSKPFQARFTRHFAELTLPPADELSIKSVFSALVRSCVGESKAGTEFKDTYELEVERVVGLLVEYLKVNNKAFQEAVEAGSEKKLQLEPLGFCSLLPPIKNLRFLHDSFCKEIPDFITFFLSEMRSQQVEHRRSSKQLDYLKIAYSEVFKHKYQKEYDRTLRSLTGHPSESLKFSSLNLSPNPNASLVRPAALNWESFCSMVAAKLQGAYYISEFMLLEVLRVVRVLERHGGNYYLIGAPGVGRRTILKISVLLADHECVETLPEDKKTGEWYFALLKSAFERQREQAVILPLDGKGAKLLAYLEKVANRSPVRDLLSTEDCEYAFSSVNQFPEVDYDKYSKAYDEVIADFLALSRRKVQLLFYSSTAASADFSRKFHYLRQETLFRWVEEVPAESILQVSSQLLEAGLPTEADRKSLTTVFLRIYGQLSALCRQNDHIHRRHFKYSAFYHYRVISRFVGHYQQVTASSREKEDVLNRSILKVHQIAQTLDKLREEVREMEPRVKEKTEKLREVVPVLEAKKRASQEVRTVVLAEKREIEGRRAEIEEMMKEVQAKIARAEPILQEANDSMLTLKRSQLSELRNNPNPHPLIRFTLENMLILLGEVQTWDNIKKILSDPSLLTRLKAIAPTQQAIAKARRRIDENREWTFESVSKVSFGVRHMVRWILSIIKFNELKAGLDGERARVEEYRGALERAEAELAGKQRQLQAQEEEIRVIEEDYAAIRGELLSLQELITINNRKFENAGLITDHLHEQVNNWHHKLTQFKQLRKNSEATSVLVTLFLEVFGALHLEEQARIQEKVREHCGKLGLSVEPHFEPFEYVKEALLRRRGTEEKALGQGRDEAKTNAFVLEKLSMEDASNARVTQAIYHFSDRPILLDPDNQAMNWIERQLAGEGEASAVITKQSFIGAVKSVEAAMREGQLLILIIEDELDSFTMDILNAKTSQGGRVVEYNKNVLHVHAQFRLLLCNKSRNPDLSGKLYITRPVVNFQITGEMLRSLLIQELLAVENREAWTLRKELEAGRRRNERAVAEIEEMIIDSLISSKRTLVDDGEFIGLLADNQAKRGVLRNNEAEWRARSAMVKRAADAYSDLTKSMSEVFLSLKLMARLNPLLSWNSQLFLQYFTQAVQLSISSPLIADDDDEVEGEGEVKLGLSNFEFDPYSLGIGNSRPTSALSFVSGLSRSLHQERKDDFEQDRHMPLPNHSFQNLIGNREMLVDESQRGAMPAEREKVVRAKFIEYIKFAFTEEERVLWGLTLCLAEHPFKDIKMLVEAKPRGGKLKQYIEAGELPEKIRNLASQEERWEDEVMKALALPNPFPKLMEALSELQILLLCKLLHPSRFGALSRTLIRNRGYADILTYSQARPPQWFQRSDHVHPILLVMGEDPLARISEYLNTKRYKAVSLVAMGEGQEKLAELVVERQSKREGLVIIHNLQIAEGFLLTLARTLQQFQVRPPHKNFRLLLITAPFEGLTEEITSYCHKYLVEQPSGVRDQMQYLREASPGGLAVGRPPVQGKLEVVLAYLHAIVGNLTKYKPYGWNLKYEFHTADFLYALQTLREMSEGRNDMERYQCNIQLEEISREESEEVDFKALKYMLGEVGYVGKLADDIDRAKMTLLVATLINPAVFAKEENEYGLRGARFSKLDPSRVAEFIEGINEADASIFGLHPAIKPRSEYAHFLLGKLAALHGLTADGKEDTREPFLKPIEAINHKFDYINKQIAKFNADLQRVRTEGTSQALLRGMGNGLLLSAITPLSKIFSLKAFANPREFFIAIRKEAAQKAGVVYEKVQLIWSLIPREAVAGVWGIGGLKLQGANVTAHGALDDGMEQSGLTLYVQAAVRKKEKETRKLVGVPLYLAEERQGQINSYGDNTNLLVMVRLEASHPQEFWILRSTAFVVM